MRTAPASRAGAFARLFLGDVATQAAFLYLAVIALVAASAPLLAPFPPLLTSVGPAFAQPAAPYVMGTDDLGRDVFSGVVHGARVSLGVGIVAATASAFIGVAMGLFAGYMGGRIDVVLMRVTEVFFVIPMVFLAILLVAFFGSGIGNVILVIVILSWSATARLVRGQVLSLKEREFVKAARALGESAPRIMFREVLPNALAPIVVNGSIQMAQAIVVEAGLSFLGLGDQNLTSWGVMLFRSQRFLMQEAWWTFVFPGLALFLTVLSLNVLADSLNNALNPRTRHRKA